MPRTILLIVCFVLLAGSVPSHAADKVVFGLDWVISSQHAPFFVAAEKGFFAENGIEVEIQRGYGSADAVKRVAAGTTTFGFGDAGGVVLSRREGLPVKLVTMIYGNTPHELLIRQDSGIKEPKDLVGKTIAAPNGSAARVMFPLFARLAGIDPGSVKWLTTDAANLMPVLMANRVVGIGLYYVSHLSDEATLADNGVPAFAMRYSDVGLDIYSNGIVARDETIRDHPDVVRRVVKSVIRGFAYTFEHPDEAAKILVAKNPQLNERLVAGDIETLKYLSSTPESAKNGFGYMDRDKIVHTRDATAEAFDAPKAKEVPPADIYTNEFLK